MILLKEQESLLRELGNALGIVISLGRQSPSVGTNTGTQE